MKRIFTFLALFLMVGVAHAAYNLQQKQDGSLEFIYSGDGASKVKISPQGDIENFGSRIQWLDDFLGDALNAQYSVGSGSDAQAADPVINAANKGTVRLTTGDTATGAATDISSLTQELVWQASNGGLVMEAKVKIDTVTNVAVNVGFTDAKADGTLEMPFSITGSTLTSNASNAVAFLFDTDATTDNWKCVGVTDDSDATTQDSGTAPTAATYQKLRIQVDSSGNARYFIDGSEVCSPGLASAVSNAVTLTPIVAADARTTASRNIDVDYLFVGQNR